MTSKIIGAFLGTMLVFGALYAQGAARRGESPQLPRASARVVAEMGRSFVAGPQTPGDALLRSP